jgi:membrane protein DedA with SNARE-associated domain
MAMLAGAGKVSIWSICIFAFLGGVIHDLLFFAAAQSKIFVKLAKKLGLKENKIKILNLILKTTRKNFFFTLIIAKFIYGVRDATVLYYAHHEKKLKKYLVNTLSAEFLWLSTILSVGWLAGRGFSEILKVLKGLEKALLFIILILISSLILHQIITKVFKKIFNIEIKKILSN